jgi:hypothetical protein
MDLTVIYLTNSRLPEKWTEYHFGILRDAVGDYPVISMTRKPLDFGLNVLQDAPESKANIFKQMLRAAKLATTPYIAIAEDDTLYMKEHFGFYRPLMDRVAYNQHRWCLYTWGEPVYSLKNFMLINSTMIAPRELLIENLEKRFKNYSDESLLGMEIGVFERHLKLPMTRPMEVKSEYPIVQFDHDYFTKSDPEKETIERRHLKHLGTIKAYRIPYWGDSEELVKKFT